MQRPETERLFFALWPEPALQAAMAREARRFAHGRGRLVPAERLHITLAFLGSVTPAARQCMERAADAIRCPAFTLTLDRIGHWRRSQVIWLSPHLVPDALHTLVRTLYEALLPCGYVPEERPFAPHITLVRRAGRGVSGTLELPGLEWPVQEFVLVRSHMQSEGSHYEVVRRWPLTQ